MLTSPAAVNLIALPTRLPITRDSLMRSARTRSGGSGAARSERQTLLPRQRREAAVLFGEQLGQRELALLHLEPAGVVAGEVEHVAEQLDQRERAGVKLLGQLGDFRRPARVRRRSADQLGQQRDRIGRRADVVADGGEETRLAHAGFLGLAAAGVELALEFFQRRDVHERRHRARRLSRSIANGRGIGQHRHPPARLASTISISTPCVSSPSRAALEYAATARP